MHLLKLDTAGHLKHGVYGLEIVIGTQSSREIVPEGF